MGPQLRRGSRNSSTRYNPKYDYERANSVRRFGVDSSMVCVSPQYYRQVWHCRSGYSQLDEVGFMMGIIFLPQWVPQAQSVSVGGRCSKPAKDIVDHPGQHFWLASPALIVDGKCHLSSWYEENPLPRMVISVTIADRSITKRP